MTNAVAYAAQATANALLVQYIKYVQTMSVTIDSEEKKFNAHPPIRALKIPQDEREDVIPSDLEYPYCEVARDPFKGALTG